MSPYQSSSQRRWAHTAAAKAVGFPTDEWDEESKGLTDKDLPERKARKKAVKHQAAAFAALMGKKKGKKRG